MVTVLPIDYPNRPSRAEAAREDVLHPPTGPCLAQHPTHDRRCWLTAGHNGPHRTDSSALDPFTRPHPIDVHDLGEVGSATAAAVFGGCVTGALLALLVLALQPAVCWANGGADSGISYCQPEATS